MGAWDPKAEEEYYQSKIDNIKYQLQWHFNTCLICTPTGPRCLHGHEIQQELDILTEDLRKVRLKNKLY